MVLAATAVFLLTGPVAAQGLPGFEGPVITPAANAELASLYRRAAVLEAALSSPDVRRVSRAREDWSRYLSDLTAWARRHQVRLVDHTVTVAAGGNSPQGHKTSDKTSKAHCDPVVETDLLNCSLKSAEVLDGRLICDYVCTPKTQPKSAATGVVAGASCG